MTGVGGLSESVADNAGEGITDDGGPEGMAMRGDGATTDISALAEGDFATEPELDIPPEGPTIDEGIPPMSILIDFSTPFTTVTFLGSAGMSVPVTPGRSS